MKASSAGLIALLANAQSFVMWEVYTITLADGTVLTWTSSDAAGTGNTGPRVTGEVSANLTTG